MKRKHTRMAAAAVLAGALWAPTARADEGGEGGGVRNRVAAVRIAREPTQTLLRIEGSRTPIFSVYTLHQPLRLVIDLAQGDVSSLETPIDVDDGVLTKIVAAQYGEGARAVGRVIIGFARRVPYDVKAEGNALAVRIAAVGKERPTVAMLAAKEAAIRERERRIREKDAELSKVKEALETQAKEADAKRVAATEAESRREALEKSQEEKERKLREKDAELSKVREALDARTREAEASKAAAAEAERRAREAVLARDAEVAKRQELEKKVAEIQGSLERERGAMQRADEELGTLRKELAGSQGAGKALERARADAVAAAKELAGLRSHSAELAEAESRARAAAATAEKALAALKSDEGAQARAAREEKAARDAELQQRETEARGFAEKLALAEQRLRQLEDVRTRVEERKDGEGAARELLAHKSAEVKALRARLEAAERLARATAEELEKVRRAERDRTQAAAEAGRVADAQARKARAAQEVSGAAVAGEGAARVSLAQPAPRKPSEAVVVRDVGFKADGGKSRVVLTVDGEPRYVVHRSGAKRLVLDLPGAHLPRHLQRKLDVSEFDGPVAMVSAYEATRPVRATRVMVDLRGPATYEVTRNGRDLRLEVTRPDPRDPDRVAKVRPVLAVGPAAKDEEATVLEEKAPPLPARARSTKRRPQYRGRRINLDLQDAELHTVLKLISEVIRLNFVVPDDVKGRVTMTLRDVPWDQALDIILKSKGIGYIREGNIIRVAPEKVLQKEAEDEAKRQVVVKESQPILLKIIPVNYATASELMPRVKDVLSDKGAVSVDTRTNRLIVRDVQQRIRAAERLVRKLDTQTPQILIEARIVEANTTFTRDIGIQWGGDITLSPATGNPTGLTFPSTVGIAGGAPLGLAPATGILNPAVPNFAVNLPAATGAGAGGAVGFTFGSIGGNVNLNLRLSAAEENGQAKIISAPKITTLDNKKATIQQGVSIPISQSSALGVNTIFVDANLTLTVTPHVTLDGSVILDIAATKNEPDFQRTGAAGDPTILRKEAKTQVLIKDGDTTVIGGIYTRNMTTNFREVPLFSKIPILGWLFKKKLQTDNRTELLIFITPRIVNRPEAIGT